MDKETFIGWIELHERAWAAEHYAGRPALSEMLDAPILAFWYPAKKHDGRFTATIHSSMGELDRYASNLLLATKRRQPERRLARLFVGKKRVKLLGVKIVTAPC